MTLNASNTLRSAIRGEYKAIWRNDYKHEKNIHTTLRHHNSKPTLIDNDIPLTKLHFLCATVAASSFLFISNAKKISYRDCLHSRFTNDYGWWWLWMKKEIHVMWKNIDRSNRDFLLFQWNMLLFALSEAIYSSFWEIMMKIEDDELIIV